MSRSTVALITVAVLLAGLYLYAFSDWFSTQRIQIIPAVRPVRGTQLVGAVLPVSFTLDGKYRLSSIKVVELSAYLTNKYVTPVWHLVSKTNSAPVQGFLYGLPIPGMVPARPDSTPKNLLPNVAYRLFVEAGRAKGDRDFQTRESGAADN